MFLIHISLYVHYSLFQEPDLADVPMGLEGEMPEDQSYTKLKETLANLPAYPESGEKIM